MADKKLLEEATIRRFMQLANIKGGSKGMLREGKDDRPPAGGRHIVEKEEMEEDLDEAAYDEASYDESMPMHEEEEAGESPGMGGMEGGDEDDAKGAIEDLLNILNTRILPKMGLEGSEVEIDSGEGEGEEGEGEGEEDGMMGGEEDGESDMMAEEDQMDEELDESIELVDETLIEKLVKRVSDRLVSEARKLKEAKLAEGKKGGASWGAKPPAARKQTVKGHGAGKGKKATPFSSSKPVKGIGGRGK